MRELPPRVRAELLKRLVLLDQLSCRRTFVQSGGAWSAGVQPADEPRRQSGRVAVGHGIGVPPQGAEGVV